MCPPFMHLAIVHDRGIAHSAGHEVFDFHKELPSHVVFDVVSIEEVRKMIKMKRLEYEEC